MGMCFRAGQRLLVDGGSLCCLQRCATYTQLVNLLYSHRRSVAGYVAVTEADQPAGLPNLINDLVAGYINDKDTIIMCVNDGSQDFGNWSQFKEAEKSDPTRARTVVVITKLDGMGATDKQVAQLKKHVDTLVKYDSRPLDIVVVRFCVRAAPHVVAVVVTMSLRHMHMQTCMHRTPYHTVRLLVTAHVMLPVVSVCHCLVEHTIPHRS